MKINPPHREWVPSPNYYRQADGKTPVAQVPQRIGIHCTVTPCEPDERYAIGREFAQRSALKSAHYVADPGGIIQCIGDHSVAEATGSLTSSMGTVHIELCDALVSVAWDHKHAARWNDDNHTRMLHRASRLTARLALAYNIPIVKIDNARHKGFLGHIDINNTFHDSTHFDPGPEFPWHSFIEQVREQASKIEALGR